MRAASPSLQSLRIASYYAAFAAAWILFSDRLLGLYVKDPETLTEIAIVKGWFFVLVTATLLYFLVRRQLAAMARALEARVEAEIAVRRSEERFRTLADLSPDIISIFDRGGNVVFNSQASYKIHGYKEADLVGRNTFDLIHPDDATAVQQAFAAALDEPSRPVMVRYRYRDADGSYRWMEASARNELHNPHLQGVIAISRDISTQIRAEEERRAMQEQLIRAQKMEAIGQLAGGVAHDFNNILTVLSMSLESLRQENLSPAALELVSELDQATGRAASLTRQLLLFSRRQVVQRRPLDLNALLGRLLGMLRRLIGENITMTFEPGPVPAWVHADPGMLEQVVVNLVVNARDAMPNGGHLHIRSGERLASEEEARRQGRHGGRHVTISVSDTGVGMDPSTRDRIFEPFFTTKEAGRGTGLGLATVFGIIQQHEGWVEVTSEPGKGSLFTILLPETASSDAPDENARCALAGGTESILVAEDDPAIRQLCLNALQRAGYRVTLASHGREALELWSRERGAFDLLLTDMIMPEGLTGLDLTEQLRREKPSLKVVVMSGYSLELTQHGRLDLSSVGFLPKPFNPSTLTQAVRRALESR
jgi:PAS domain S-box-containing protein